jgi:glutamate-ammonia-ligase adenylyltransferase
VIAVLQEVLVVSVDGDLSWLGERELAGAEKSSVFARLVAMGFDDPSASWRNLSTLHSALGFEDGTRKLLGVVLGAAGPDLALAGVAALVKSLDPEKRQWLLALGPDDLASVAELFSISGSLGELLVRRASEIDDILSAKGLDAESVLPPPPNVVDVSPDDAAAAIARFKRVALLRTAVLDVGRRVDIAKVFALLTAGAEETVRLALKAAAKSAGVQERGLVIFGMGKLGGCELNYSSDIDLVFMQDEAAGAGESVRRIAEALVAVLEKDTAWGRPVRIDLRLRPEGSAGPLVPAIRSARQYYETRASAWEYQALVRSRPIAGEIAAGLRFLEWADPLVYPEKFSPQILNSLVSMRRRHEGPDVHVKQRRGGIRDVEFLVQWLCMAEGRAHPEVKARATLAAVAGLNRAGILSENDAAVLDGAYRFLRSLEHRLQLAQELQTFTLPNDSAGKKLLARSLGLKDEAALETEFSRRTEGVTEVVDRLLSARGAGAHERAAAGKTAVETSQLAGLPGPVARSLERLAAKYAFDPASVAAALALPVARERYLERLETILAQPDFPVDLLKTGRAAVLLNLIGYSGFFFEKMMADPGMGCIVLNGPPSPSGVMAYIAETIPSAPVDGLARFRLRALAAVAALDFTGGFTDEIPGLIAAVNETVIQRLISTAGLGGRLEVYALGRLGGREGSYSSDADLLFIAPDVAASHKLEPPVQEILRFLNREVGLGTDERLRPEGEKGVLIPTRDGFENYVSGGGMQVWEFLALWGRLRPLSEPAEGHMPAIEKLLSAYMPRQNKLFEEARRMRQLQRETADPADIKRGKGGFADVEMMVYALSAGHRVRRGSFLQTINDLTVTGALTLPSAAVASAAYRFFSKIERFLRLARPDRPGILPRVEERRGTALAAGYRDGIRKSAARLLSEEIDYYRDAVAQLFEQVTKD